MRTKSNDLLFIITRFRILEIGIISCLRLRSLQINMIIFVVTQHKSSNINPRNMKGRYRRLDHSNNSYHYDSLSICQTGANKRQIIQGAKVNMSVA